MLQNCYQPFKVSLRGHGLPQCDLIVILEELSFIGVNMGVELEGPVT